MKAVQFDQLNPLDAANQEMTGFTRFGADHTLGGCLEWDEQLTRILTRVYVQAYIKSTLERIYAGTGGNGGSTESTSFTDIEKEVKDAMSRGDRQGALKALLNYGPIKNLFDNLTSSGHLSSDGIQFNNTDQNSQKWEVEDNSSVVTISLSISHFDVLNPESDWTVCDLVQDIYIELYSAALGVGQTRMTVNATEPQGDRHTSERYLQACYATYSESLPMIYTAGERINDGNYRRLEGAYNDIGNNRRSLMNNPEVKEQMKWAYIFLKN